MAMSDSVTELENIKEQQRLLLNLNTNTPFTDYVKAVKTAVGFNSIGRQGSFSFGVGVTDNLPIGMSPMEGTHTPGHDNYGNYQYSDGSIMVWIPAFYYRWNDSRNYKWSTHTVASVDVRGSDEYVSNSAAAADGFAMHRAFMDGGIFKDGFFIDKYQCSNNSGIASSIKYGEVIALDATAVNSITKLNNSPPATLAGAFAAAKTRGPKFFPTTIFMKKALATLSVAAAQGNPSTNEVAWMNNPSYPFPKGANNGSLCLEDVGVTWTTTPTTFAPNYTGSSVPFNKTTHNGQNSGVTDTCGNAVEMCFGFTRLASVYYVLKDTVKASDIQGGSTTVNDAYGSTGVAANYINLGAAAGPLTGGTGTTTIMVGHATLPSFNNTTAGAAWSLVGAGVPLSTGVGGGQTYYGEDVLYINKTITTSLCVGSGGGNYYASMCGGWYTDLTLTDTQSSINWSFRSGLFKD